MAEQRVTVKFDGQAHQVSIETFVQVLMSYTRILQASASELDLSDGFKVNIVATEPGSLDVVLSLVSEGLSGLLSFLGDNRDGLESIVVLAGGVLALRGKLTGKSAARATREDGDGVVIEADDSEVRVEKHIYNVYADSNVGDAMGSMFETLDENPAIEGLEIKRDGKTTFRAGRDEFAPLATAPILENDGEEHVLERVVSLTVVKPVLAESSSRKWEFIYRGEKITASISDTDFLSKLSQYRFGIGTMMTVDIDILKKYSDKYRTMVNRRYMVTKVHKVQDPPETEPLF